MPRVDQPIQTLQQTFHIGQVIDVVYAPANPSMTALNPEQAWAVVLYDAGVRRSSRSKAIQTPSVP